MKKTLLASVLAIGLVAVGGAVWLGAAPAPTVGSLSATPVYVVVNTPTSVLFTVHIADSSVIPDGVNLVRTDASGKTLATVGVMRDDGTNGDAMSNDRVFSHRLNMNESAIGAVYYRASVPFKGILQRVTSSVVQIHLDPFALPPDPGEAGKQTVAGIDSDRDGVRDDFERYVAYRFAANSSLLQAANQFGLAMGSALDQGRSSTPTETSRSLLASTRCLASVVGVYEAYELTTDLQSNFLNTPGRVSAYDSLQVSLRGAQFDSPALSEFGRFCTLA